MRGRLVVLPVIWLPLAFGSTACSAKKAAAGHAPPARLLEVAQSDGGDAAADRRMIWNASLSVEVPKERDVEPSLEKARALAESMGGYASSESTGGIVLRVPNARLREAMAALEKLGEVSYKHVSGDDVTAQYRDLEVRIENERKFQARLRELAEQSATVEELLAVEKEQARVTTELERLEAEMRLLENRTSLATLHLSVSKEVRPGPLGWVFYGVYRGVKWLFVWD